MQRGDFPARNMCGRNRGIPSLPWVLLLTETTLGESLHVDTGWIIIIDQRGSNDLKWALVKLPECHDAWGPKKERGDFKEN